MKKQNKDKEPTVKKESILELSLTKEQKKRDLLIENFLLHKANKGLITIERKITATFIGFCLSIIAILMTLIFLISPTLIIYLSFLPHSIHNATTSTRFFMFAMLVFFGYNMKIIINILRNLVREHEISKRLARILLDEKHPKK